MKKYYNKLMRECIKLAKNGEGFVSPNPLVGCIIFDDDFNIISKGWHEKYGENHAERNAILSCSCDLKGKSLIVNLEPCSHYGKTPPCADLIIEKGIKRVIVGIKDVNPIVSGRGIERLKNAGIEVVVGVLEKECKELNKIFIKNQLENKPYITIKTATTLDGKIATRTGYSKWITDSFSREIVHKMRNKYDAILTSSQTVINDNPSLTCRIKNGRNPVRIILDTNLTTSPDCNVYNNDNTKVIIVCSNDEARNKYPDNVQILKCSIKNGHVNLKEAVEKIYDMNIKSILIEAGGRLNKALIEENLVDELVQFIAPKILGDNTAKSFIDGFDRLHLAECNNLKITSTKKLKNDIMITGYFL